MTMLVFKEEVYRIIGASIEVRKELGSGFLESVYQEALEWELTERQIPFERQKVLPIYYKDRILEKRYIADLVCFDQIIVELKSIEMLSSKEHAQILNYLKASRMKLGLLINFGSNNTSLEWRRMIC